MSPVLRFSRSVGRDDAQTRDAFEARAVACRDAEAEASAVAAI